MFFTSSEEDELGRKITAQHKLLDTQKQLGCKKKKNNITALASVKKVMKSNRVTKNCCD